MNDRNKILICTFCGYYIGFEIRFTKQIINLKHSNISIKNDTIKFNDKKIPFVNIFRHFNCNNANGNFILILNSDREIFSTSVSKIEGIIQVESEMNQEIAKGLQNLTIYDYLRGVILFNELPVVVVDTNKLLGNTRKKRKKEEQKKR